MILPSRLALTCRHVPERQAWLERLPNEISDLNEQAGRGAQE
jgi:hypothetical protein